MINVTRLYCEKETQGDEIRYGKDTSVMNPNAKMREKSRTAELRKPVVVWNITRTCNLYCIHCYSDSENKKYEDELTQDRAFSVMEDLADFEIPALLFSGGEPLIHPHIFDLAKRAGELGIRITLSTNGTLITEEVARKIKENGFIYAGISLDGIGEINDRFRGKKGAFEKTIRGIRNCVAIGQRVGLRLTLTRHNYECLDQIFEFIETEGLKRACFYHLAYSGRGNRITDDDLTHTETRDAVLKIMAHAKRFTEEGREVEILTVDNHVDGVLIYKKLLEEGNTERARRVKELLTWNGGGLYSSGIGVADIDFKGNVHADQFWMHYSFGNIKERKFSEIWMDETDPLMKQLKHKKEFIKGKCRVCKWLLQCGGSLRVRAEVVYQDPMAPDPACYLSDEECGITPEIREEIDREEKFPIPEGLSV